jgi:hypothetical protein
MTWLGHDITELALMAAIVIAMVVLILNWQD